MAVQHLESAWPPPAPGEGQALPTAGPIGLAGDPLPLLERLIGDLGELVTRLGAGLDLARVEQGQLSGRGGRLAGVALGLDAAISRLGAARAEVHTLLRQVAQPKDLGGEKTVTDWVARTSRQGRGAALAQGHLAEVIETMPRVRDAVRAGELTEGHARVVGQILTGASEQTREILTGRAEEIVAAGRSLPVPVLRKKLIAEVNALEAEAADHSYRSARARRFLQLTPREGGIRVDGFLDPLAGATLRTALDALTPTPAADDDRTPGQRSADALVDLGTHALGIGDNRVGAQLRPHLTVLLREETWWLLNTLRSGRCGRTPADGGQEGGSGASDGVGSAFVRSGLTEPPPLAELLDGTPLPFAALDVLACDALFQRLVLDPTGQPLDLGRTERTFTKDLRHAILTRDRHCQWPGCTIRATWCEVHHLQHWADLGPTTLANGITLCSNHHHRVHDAHVQIRVLPGGFSFSASDGRTIGETTRLHDSLLVPARGRPQQRLTGERPGRVPDGEPVRPGAQRGSPELRPVELRVGAADKGGADKGDGGPPVRGPTETGPAPPDEEALATGPPAALW